MGRNDVQLLILGDSRSAQRAVTELNRELRRGETQIERTGRKLQETGRNLSRISRRYLLPMAAGAVFAFGQFDAAMTQSTAIMDDVDEAMRTKMAATAKQVSEDLNISSRDAAQGYFFLASAGLDAAQSVAAMPQVARFAKAGMFDLATATDLATDAQSALGLASEDNEENLGNLRRVTDVMVRGNQLANTSVQQLAEALTNKAGAALRAVNKDVEEGGAVLLAYADQGEKGAGAGEKLNIVLRDLQRAALNNSDAFDAAGIAVFDANGNLNNMADIVAGLEDHLDGMSDAQRRAAFETLGFQDRSLSAMIQLLGTSDAIRSYEARLRDAAGATEQVANRQMEAFTEKLGQARQVIVNAGIDVGETLAPMVLRGAEAIARLAEGFTNLPGPVRTGALALGGLTVAAGPLLTVTGSLLRNWQQLASVLRTAPAATSAAASGFEAIGAAGVSGTRGLGALAALVSPTGLIVAGLAAVAAGAWLVKRNVDQMAESHDSAAEAAPKLAESLGLAYESIEAAAEGAADAATQTEHAFAQANANAIRQLRELQSMGDREDFLVQIGWELVQHGADVEQAFDAVQQLADAAGISLPVGLDAEDLADTDRQLDAIGGTARRVAREIEANWLGLGTATKETMTGIASAAADAFKLGDIQTSIAMVERFEQEIRASSLSVGEQNQAINFLTDEYLKLTDVAGLSTSQSHNLAGALRELTSDASTAAGTHQELIGVYLDAIDAGKTHEEALDAVADAMRDAEAATSDTADAIDDSADSADSATGPIGELEGAMGDLAGETETAAERTRQLISANRELVDPVFAAQSAVERLEQANADLAEKQADSSTSAEDLAEAQREAERAAIDVDAALKELQAGLDDGTVSVDELSLYMQQLRDRGLLPASEATSQLEDDLHDLADRYQIDIEANTSNAIGRIDALIERMRGAGLSQRDAVLSARAARQADGAIIRFAGGGMAERHIAQIAPPGTMRLWAEPETGGEAYIPLGPGKRGRALQIWEETGRRLGVFADGGLLGGHRTRDAAGIATDALLDELRGLRHDLRDRPAVTVNAGDQTQGRRLADDVLWAIKTGAG